MPFYQQRYETALALAARSHRMQLRKATDTPYITHCVHVALILERAGFSDDICIAGLLHDAIEDTSCTLQDIEDVCGADVARLVAAMSETKLDTTETKRPWHIRKEEKLAHLREAGAAAIAIAAADTLHNIRTTIDGVEQDGGVVWQRFKQPDKLAWYYQQTLALVTATYPDHPLTQELEDAVKDIAELIPYSSQEIPVSPDNQAAWQ